ncbi:Biosynthetic arginine decarboxylase [Thioalkalivibrio nitratireducens DSM 14787]|uniref:Biosynthetic arginine decarboxylase n=1 Tax=Thioalkalivibrio nitratireducens (strain DSM 14787 / UNIQEM 213 / ALEN2) TaxID=1255043 RepID=L0DSV0_THIND|nr:biosynthetic arginine decarboxylase [Thioalkalivibrio nitratireducens]AGA32088.1 Biosynthetic arginine decarboxylase [Thioalkalivibrio nitratireducens DSM 14787]
MNESNWTLEQARRAYRIEHWNGGFFEINGSGHVVMRRPDWPDHPGVDLFELAQRLRQEHIGPPVLVRFQDILGSRVQRLTRAFARAAEELEYDGGYTAIYPIKVNQQHSVVRRILSEPGTRVGLEAGSKPELMAVLALAPAGAAIICNGYKDREYVRLALIGRRLGHRVYIVVEKPSELEEVIRQSADMGIPPLLGLRVRLASIGKGKWQNTGGEKAKFGLSAADVLHLLERLREMEWLTQLQLLHFHMGSQIANIRDIQAGMGEAAHYFAALNDAGARLQVVDVGGGLGVDYEGTRSRNDCSMNYSVEEYALNILRPLAQICRDQHRPMPEIFTESGRAMTAHHAVLITNVIDCERAPGATAPAAAEPGEPSALADMRALFEDGRRPASEIYHDAAYGLSESQARFARGLLSLDDRARAEELYFAICQRLLQQAGAALPGEIRAELVDKLADKYFCNFSVFQSIPDAWAIDQVFPVLPLHRLDEPPARRAVLQDLTCDSDGHVDRYVEGETTTSTLALHPWRDGEEYFLGIFLVGAYQEILGDLHNLFGDTDSINVELTEDGGYRLLDPERGDTVDELLRYVHFEPDVLRRAYRDKIYAIGLRGAEAGKLLAELEQGLTGYTYLED